MMLPIFNSSSTPNWDWASVIKHWIHDDPYQPEHLTEEYYRIKYAIADFLKPKRICEIGVRAGYSAAAFLEAGHTEFYCGVDYNVGTHGGIVGYSNYAMSTVLPSYKVDFKIYIDVNSQIIHELPDGPFDLLHVDGDHTQKGVYHDISLGMKSAKWILVDDIDYIVPVAHGTFDAIKDFKVEEAYYVYDQKYRGNILIKNPNQIL